MTDPLTPQEVEALLSSLALEEPGSTTAETAHAPDSSSSRPRAPVVFSSRYDERGKRHWETYDFRRPDKLSKDQLRTLQMVHESFARLCTSALSAFLRTPVQVELMSVDQVPYEEYLRTINESVFNVLNLAPLSGQSILEIEFTIAFAMIDRMLGGTGKPIQRTALTEIEKPLVIHLAEKMLSAFRNAWEAIVILHPRVEFVETSAQFINIVPPTDIVVTILFEIRFGEYRGAMSLCIPYLLIKPLGTKLSGQKWASTSHKKRSPHTRLLIASELVKSRVECRAELGTTTITVKELLSLKEGDTLRLEQRTDEDILFYVADHPKFLGTPSRRGNNLAFRVTRSVQL
ncbi:MAG: flagellar motor switch protein FliM [Candidatus Caldarchaeum sp.]